ncbi:MAG: SPOR domain-containing protein [Gammaproteobacteria bacterium]|nr:SPOR domain-containing protein [Gammaproteobacteria bacterium]
MDDGLKKRLIGATVLVSLIVIFVPMLLQHEPVLEQGIHESNIPPPPKTDFSSRVIPQKSEPAPPASRTFAPVDGATGEYGPDGTAGRPAAAAAPQSGQVETREGLSAWMIQVGSFSLRENAENLVKQLREKAFAADIEQVSVKGNMLFRVLVGPEVDRNEAEKLLQRVNAEIKPLNIEGALKSYP